MHIKKRKRNKSFRYRKNDEVVLKDPELDLHRRLFLGKPGSELWRDFHEGWKETKRKLFQKRVYLPLNIGKTYIGGVAPNDSIAASVAASVAASNKQSDSHSEDKINTDGMAKAPRQVKSVNQKKLVNQKELAIQEQQSQPKKIQCGAPMGWLVDLFEMSEMKGLLQFAQEQVNAEFIVLPNRWDNMEVMGLLDVVKDQSNGPCKAEDIKTEYIPFFLQVYMRLAERLKAQVNADNTNDLSANKLATEYNDYDLRDLLLFNITLLRNMNMYANPMFFDDLYYYYYFLQLDKIFPSMDDFFRFFEMPKGQPKKTDAKVGVDMLVYQQFPSDDASKEEQDKKKYGYEMRERVSGFDTSTDFDRFLNLVQLYPDPNYKLPVIAKASKEFQMQNITDPASNDPSIIKLDVVNPPATKQTGGDGILDRIGIPDMGIYKYLDDNPLYRNINDLFDDESAMYDGEVYLCIYSLDKSCNFDGKGVTPFLKFITTKKEDKFGFPSFHYKSLLDAEQNNSSFKCDMFNVLVELLDIQLCSSEGGADLQPRKQMGEQLPIEPQPQEPSKSEDKEPSKSDDNAKEELKIECSSFDSALDSIYIGLVAEEIQGKKQLFAFLNYDALESIIDSPSLDKLFCRNPESTVYPISDLNVKTTLKWATVDELFFEKKILEDEVESNISELFLKHDKLWNIEDENGQYALIPFVVFGVEKRDNAFATILANPETAKIKEEEDMKIEEYGLETEDISDAYDSRYCFTIHPLLANESDSVNYPPRRFVMFAWKTRYVVDEPTTDTQYLEEKEDTVLTEEEMDQMEVEKLLYPTIYTITNNRFTNHTPVVTWGIRNKSQFVGM